MTDATVAVPQAVALKGVPDVELVAVGAWRATTGPVTITDDDLRGALAARECPGVASPVIKLGHDEPAPGADRIRWDGEPAVGWVSNMRLSPNSAKLVGDYTGVPAWLVDVMPSAYPQRSVEIQRNFRCQIGHIHPFVITAVSLLGVYPPAVGVLRSLNDVQALYTLAAADGNPPAEVTRSIAAGLAAPVSDDSRRSLSDVERQSGADFSADLNQWEQAVADLLTAYGVVQRRQREQLTAQIAPLVDAGRFEDLAGLNVETKDASDLIFEAMVTAAAAAIAAQIAEATAQGIVGLTAVPDEMYLRRAADGIAATMASTLSATAGRDAAQLAAPGVSGASVADGVDAKLSDLSDRFLRDQFGGAVGAARMSGRYTVLSVAPNGQHYAAEVNDANTCGPCRDIDGTRFADLDAAMGAYGAGGYHLCAGGGRCRGRTVTVWEASTVQQDQGDALLDPWMPTTGDRGRDPWLAAVPLRVGDRIYLARVALAKTHFDPNQKRDQDGKWTDGGGGGGKKPSLPKVGGEHVVPTGQSQAPLTDEEFDARTKLVRSSIDRVRKTLATDITHTDENGHWTAERDAIHREIADEVYARSNHVPNDGKAVIAGGLGGAGKTTVLTKHAGVDTGQYMTVNPDDIKEELAARGLMPDIPGAAGLSPMERAMLVHEESSRIAHMLANRAYAEKRNIIWDITMSSESSVKSRVAALKKAGYGQIDGVFVDIPVETSVERAMARYRRGVDKWRAGSGYGGRYVPPDIIRAQKTGTGATINRKVFDEVRQDFTGSSVYDNSRTGEPPVKVG